MINYIEHHECELNEFPAWLGGSDVLDMLSDHAEAYEFVENYIEEVLATMGPGEVTDTFINDLLWFEVPEVLEEAGFNPNTFERTGE